jgi:hypothetical protein
MITSDFGGTETNDTAVSLVDWYITRMVWLPIGTVELKEKYPDGLG